jgi:hypothetical protein
MNENVDNKRIISCTNLADRRSGGKYTKLDVNRREKLHTYNLNLEKSVVSL